MPSFTFTPTVLLGATDNPLSGWQYEYLPWPAHVTVLATSIVAGIVGTYTSGSETILEESPIQAGGSARVIPNPLNTSAITWQAAAGHRLKLNYRNTTLADDEVQGIIEVEPL